MSDDAKAETEWCCDGEDCSKIIQEKDGQVTDDDEALFLCHECFESHEQKKAEEAEAEAEANATRKQCSVCSERSSCGNYNEDKKWICEGCEEEEE
jgi:hypothetical protein